ncbi:50S ribosomal protein L28 [Mesomycoplasma lagogenitalium]|uniref:Large ribosomal subunit protein bL28 n=1 Tax=Mesomycoplasma lagogenitalium TaxID=171286 RepID=A0ABY8LUZ5_9BACT|nr:50S ribosomal protein L28 [Mesomycoplasma lagogenitalium]WGI36555.1 50S ribosomal protein L28 [Mesomycoplasma lagogenitalium]
MARRDDITGKGSMTGNRRSHALNATKRTFRLNLQKIKVMNDNGRVITIKVSAKTARTLRKQGISN